MTSYTVTLNTYSADHETEEQAMTPGEALDKAVDSLATVTKEKPTSFMIVGCFNESDFTR